MTTNQYEVEQCEVTVIHQDIINQVADKMPREGKFVDLAELFKVYGDSTRIKMMWALAQSEMCVCDIAALLQMTQSAISHQLRILKQTRLVKYRKQGKVVYYSLDDNHVMQIFNQGLAHVEERS